jgi:signal transduction histidine kinase
MTDARPAKPPSPSPTARTAELLVEIAVATAGEADLDQILLATLDRLAELVPFTGGSIALIDGDELVVKAAIGPFADGALGTRMPRGRGRSWQVIDTLEPSLVSDIAAAGLKIQNASAAGAIRSWLGVPLARRGEGIGLLEIDSTEADAFGPEDLALMQTVARALSGPVELASLYRRLLARERQQAAIATLGQIAVDRELPELLRRAVELVATTLEVDHSTVYELSEDEMTLKLISAHGGGAGLVGELIVGAGTNSQAGFAIATGGPVILEDVATEDRFSLALRDFGIQSGISVPIGGHGRPFGVLAAHADTRLRFTPDDVNFLVAMANVLASASERNRREDLERQAAALREAFIGVISHELRTPITTIYGSSKVLRRPASQLDPEVREQVIADIEAESERLQRLVEDLLVLSRAERGLVQMASDPILVGHAITRAVAGERERWPSRNFAFKATPGLPPVAGEETYVEQVVRNLLANAAKYGPPGSTITVRAEPGEAGIVVRVLDEGPGIKEDEAARLFELFYRSEAASRQAAGSGIGLFVCQQLVEAMGGRIWARNRDDRADGGAEFVFTLPAVELDEV